MKHVSFAACPQPGFVGLGTTRARGTFAKRGVSAALIALALIGGWLSPLGAQGPSATPDNRPPLPSGPLLERAPEFSQWTIASKASGASAPAEGQGNASPTPTPAPTASVPGQKAPPKPTDMTITVVKTKDIRMEQTVSAGGTKIQKWCFPDMQLTVRGRSAPVVSVTNSASHGADYSDYSKTDFTNLGWISAKNYTGVSAVMGHDCYIFKDKIKLAPDSPSIPAVACITVEGRMPAALQLGDEVRTYQFGPPPTEMLVPPPDVAKMLERWRKALRQAALPPANP